MPQKNLPAMSPFLGSHCRRYSTKVKKETKKDEAIPEVGNAT